MKTENSHHGLIFSWLSMPYTKEEVDRRIKPWFTVYFFGIGHPCHDQLTPVKTGYPLTSITWPCFGLKFTTHRGHMFFEVDRWQTAGFPIASRAHVRLTCWKQGRIVLRPDLSLKFNRIITQTLYRKPHRKVTILPLNQVLNNPGQELRF